MKRQVSTSNEEPEQRKFELPSEGEHQFQVVDKWEDKNDDNIVIVKLEVSEGDETGRSILHRVNLDSKWKGFFLTRLFLKSISEPYKGEFEIDDDNWIGKCFYATIIHNQGNNGKTYANIDQFIFDRPIEQAVTPDILPSEDEKDMTNDERQIKIDNNNIAWDE